MKEVELFKTGLINLNTRKFGTVTELIFQKLFNFKESNTLAFDKYDKKGNRVEIKCSRVYSKTGNKKITLENFKDICIQNSKNILIKSSSNDKFWCNIEQVKPKEFDILYFGLFFDDEVEIFKINSKEIPDMKYYNEKQHRGNVGEGQFHIKQDNLQFFRDNYLIKTITYKEIFELV